MSRRLILLFLLLSGVGTWALVRIHLTRTPQARLAGLAEQSAARFIRLRDAESLAEGSLWAPMAFVGRLEQSIVSRVESALATGDLDRLFPGLNRELDRPSSLPLIWLKVDVLSVRTNVPTASGAPSNSDTSFNFVEVTSLASTMTSASMVVISNRGSI